MNLERRVHAKVLGDVLDDIVKMINELCDKEKQALNASASAAQYSDQGEASQEAIDVLDDVADKISQCADELRSFERTVR
jgi:hypothetical protein